MVPHRQEGFRHLLNALPLEGQVLEPPLLCLRLAVLEEAGTLLRPVLDLQVGVDQNVLQNLVVLGLQHIFRVLPQCFAEGAQLSLAGLVVRVHSLLALSFRTRVKPFFVPLVIDGAIDMRFQVFRQLGCRILLDESHLLLVEEVLLRVILANPRDELLLLLFDLLKSSLDCIDSVMLHVPAIGCW